VTDRNRAPGSDDGFELPETGPDGHLLDPDGWSEDVARELAARDGVELGELHWWLIRFVRGHFQRYGNPPLMRMAVAALREAGVEDASSRTLYRLFPDGPIRLACRYAGLPAPDACL